MLVDNTKSPLLKRVSEFTASGARKSKRRMTFVIVDPKAIRSGDLNKTKIIDLPTVTIGDPTICTSRCVLAYFIKKDMVMLLCLLVRVRVSDHATTFE